MMRVMDRCAQCRGSSEEGLILPGEIWKDFGEDKPLESHLKGVRKYSRCRRRVWKVIWNKPMMSQKGLGCMGWLRSTVWSSMRGAEESKAEAVAGKTLTAGFGGLNLMLLVMDSYRRF